jgi:NDP-sugar pyrophosphorylase family protein
MNECLDIKFWSKLDQLQHSENRMEFLKCFISRIQVIGAGSIKMSRRKIRLTGRIRSSCINSNTRPFHCFDPSMSILWRDHNIMKRSSVCESCFHSQKLMVSHCKTLMILHCCCPTLHDLTLCMMFEDLHLSTVCDLALEILDEVQQ